MPVSALGTVSGLSSLLHALALVCKAIAKFGPIIRPFVPEGNQVTYDSALAAILDACDVIRAIDFADTLAGTNPPFGSG